MIAVVSVLLLVGAALSRRELVESLIRGGLERVATEVESLTVVSVGHDRIVLRDIHLSEGAEINIGRIEAAYTWASLREEKLTSLEIRDVRLGVSIEEEGDAVEEAGTGGAGAAGSSSSPRPAAPWVDRGGAAKSLPLESLSDLLAFPVLPAHRLDLSGIQIDLYRGEETFKLRGGMHATQSGVRLEAVTQFALLGPAVFAPGVLLSAGADFELRIDAEPGRLRATLAPAELQLKIHDRGEPVALEAVTPEIAVQVIAMGPSLPPRIEVASDGGRITAPEIGLEARQIDLRTAFAANESPGMVDLKIAELLDLRMPPRIPPLSLAANLRFGDQRISFQSSLTRREGQQSFTLHGYHDSSSGRGRADFHMKPIVFIEGGLQPSDLAPGLTATISNAGGSVEALGAASWTLDDDGSPDLRSRVEIALRDVRATTPLIRVEGFNAVIEVEGPWPLSTPPQQLLQIGLIDVGFPLTDAMASLQLHPDQTLSIEEAQLHFAGGTLHTSGRIDPAADEQALILEVSAIDLARLFELVNLAGLSGSGSLSGRIPLVRTRDAIEVRDARLSNWNPDAPAESDPSVESGAETKREGQRVGGRIRYLPEPGVRAAAAGQSELGQALIALENFHFEELDLTLSGDTKDVVLITLHLAGSNPDFFEGFPVDFTLNLESRLVDLVRQVSSATQLAGEIESRISSFSSKAANFRLPNSSTPNEGEVAAPSSDR